MGGGGPCWSKHYLKSSIAQLNYSPALLIANIHEGVQYSRGITTTPLSYGVMGANEYRNLPKIIKDSADVEESQIRVTLVEDLGIGEAIVLTTIRREIPSSGVGWDNIMEWRVYPESGFLPLEVTVFDAPGVWASKTSVNDVRKLKSGAHWPFSIQTVSNPNSVFPRMFQLKTTRLSFDTDEVKNSLAIPVPPGTKIVNPENMRSCFVYEEQEIRPEELADLLLQGAMTIQRRNRVGR